MSAQTNETLIRSLYTAFNARKYDDAAKLAADKFEWRDVPTGGVFRGPTGMRQYMEGWINAFDDAKAEIRRIIATDKFVVTEVTGRGTHTGPLETPSGSVPATNRKVEIPFCEVAAIENGKIVSGATYYDVVTILQQLGVTELAGAHR